MMRRPSKSAALVSTVLDKSQAVLFVLLVIAFAVFPNEPAQREREFQIFDAPLLIAHGGGGLPQAAHTNSLEALEYSKSTGFCLIEVDFDTTNETIALVRKSVDGSLKQELANGLTPMTMDRLLEWMRSNPAIRIITDTKDNNDRLLTELATTDRRDQFIVQIYDPDEYEKVRQLGFGSIILTLYKSHLTDDEILNFSRGKGLFAVTIPRKRAHSSDLAKRLDAEGIPALSHTVNYSRDAEALMRRSVMGFYTDYLMPTTSCAASKAGHV